MIYFAKWKIGMIAAVIALGVLTAMPNLLSKDQAAALPSWLPHGQVVLGLDLQGGSHLLLEVGVDAVIKERLEAMVDDARSALRKARIRYGGLGIDGYGIAVTVRDADKMSEARSLMRKLDSGIELAEGENGRLSVHLTEAAIRARKSAAIEQSIEIVRRRIDETGVREPTIQRQGEDRILVQLPGLDDPERVKRLLGKTAKLTFHLVDDTASVEDALAGRKPPGTVLVPALNQLDPTGRPRMYLLQKRVMVSGDTLVDSKPGFDQRSGEAIVSFRFDTVGAKRFGEVTRSNVNRPFAIVLDDKVISAPVIREPILGGTGQISGGFTVQETQDLSLLLRAGALPAPLNILEERTVGPGLGADSIAAGTFASWVGFIAVVIFMLMTYGLFGAMADVALVANIVLILGLLSALGATLTLPGIAGIVLTIGMAVDANVLIFERIREETRLGRSPISAIEAGYARAITTIVDANVTTLIAALLLYQFGSGPVRGFAVTLAIGIVTSMFTAIMLTRLMIAVWLRRTRPAGLPT